MSDQPPPPACPVAAIAREAGILIAAHRRLDERMLGMTIGAARTAAGVADGAVMDRLGSLEGGAAPPRARSLEGALFQLVLAKAEVGSLRGLADVAEAHEAKELTGRA